MVMTIVIIIKMVMMRWQSFSEDSDKDDDDHHHPSHHASTFSRIWNMDTMMPANTLYRRNIYSEELLKTLYIDPGLGFIKEQDTSAAAGEKVSLPVQMMI